MSISNNGTTTRKNFHDAGVLYLPKEGERATTTNIEGIKVIAFHNKIVMECLNFGKAPSSQTVSVNTDHDKVFLIKSNEDTFHTVLQGKSKYYPIKDLLWKHGFVVEKENKYLNGFRELIQASKQHENDDTNVYIMHEENFAASFIRNSTEESFRPLYYYTNARVELSFLDKKIGNFLARKFPCQKPVQPVSRISAFLSSIGFGSTTSAPQH
jgi:DNA-binding ferritin-like protein (Dps family)